MIAVLLLVTTIQCRMILSYKKNGRENHHYTNNIQLALPLNRESTLQGSGYHQYATVDSETRYTREQDNIAMQTNNAYSRSSEALGYSTINTPIWGTRQGGSRGPQDYRTSSSLVGIADTSMQILLPRGEGRPHSGESGTGESEEPPYY